MIIEWASLGRAALFLGIPFILIIFYLQFRWSKTCDENIQVLIALKGGGGKYELAPKAGGEVTITNPETGDARTWMVNELSTIEVTYPGLGFLPKFLQKQIRMAIVSEGDWEPLLNRSPHRKMIASPDVVEFLKDLKDGINNQKMKDQIEVFLNGVSTGPTREMVASPEALGNLMRNSVLKALATVGTDFLDTLKSVNQKLSRMMSFNPLITYIGIGIVIVICIYLIINQMKIGGDVSLIKDALGIVPPTPTAAQ